MNKTDPARTAFCQEGAVNLQIEALDRHQTQTMNKGFVAIKGEGLLRKKSDDKAGDSLPLPNIWLRGDC